MARKNRNRKTNAGVPKLQALTQGKTVWHVYLLPARDGSNTYEASKPEMIQLTSKPESVSIDLGGESRYLSHRLRYVYYSNSAYRSGQHWDADFMTGDCAVHPVGVFQCHNLNRVFTSLRKAQRYIRLYHGTPMSESAIEHKEWCDELDRMLDSSYDDFYDAVSDYEDDRYTDQGE